MNVWIGTLQFFMVLQTWFCKATVTENSLIVDVFERGFESYLPTGIHLFKASNGNTIKMCESCSKLTITTPEWRRMTYFWRLFYMNFQQILHIVLVCPLLTLNK